MKKPPDPNDNRTMELDAVDDAAEVSLEDADVSAESEASGRAATRPPPLPPEASLPPVAPRPSLPMQAAPPPKSRALLYGAILVGVLLVGLLGGSRIAGMMRGSSAAASSASASPSGAHNVITIPTVELGSEGEQDAAAP